MGLDLQAALAVTTGDLSDQVEAIQNEMGWDDEITLSAGTAAARTGSGSSDEGA
jgi:hypothetical protein